MCKRIDPSHSCSQDLPAKAARPRFAEYSPSYFALLCVLSLYRSVKVQAAQEIFLPGGGIVCFASSSCLDWRILKAAASARIYGPAHAISMTKETCRNRHIVCMATNEFIAGRKHGKQRLVEAWSEDGSMFSTSIVSRNDDGSFGRRQGSAIQHQSRKSD